MFNSFIHAISNAFHGGSKPAPKPAAPKASPPAGHDNPFLQVDGVRYDPTPQGWDPSGWVNPSLNSGGGTNYNAPQVQSYSSTNSGRMSGGGYAYAQPAAPDTTGLQNTARNLISQIQSAYGSLEGHIAPVIQDKVNQYLQGYDTQTKDLNKAFQNDVGQTQNVYAGRGLQDSSFLGNALDDNSHIYNQNLDALNLDKTQKLGAIGQYASGLKNNASAASQQYAQYLPDLGKYSASDLGTLNGQLQGALPGIQSQVAGMGTNADFLNTLNQYAPAANQGAAQLGQKLQQLVTSSAPIFAKKQIASGLIKSSQLQDPNAQSYWQDYFQNLLNGAA